MPPEDNRNDSDQTSDPATSTEVQFTEKMSFWDKLKHLFDKKVKPQEPKLTPPPEDTAPADQNTAQPSEQTAPGEQSSSQETDPETGAPQATESSAPDADGSTTAPEVAVPDDVKANPGEETPTVPGAPSSGDQFTQPSAPEVLQEVGHQQAPQQQQYPQPPTQQQQPPTPPQQPTQNQ